MEESHLELARAAMLRGDVLAVFDHASSALAADPENLDARYEAALALARLGCLDRAAENVRALCELVDRTRGISVELARDAHALDARILKDQALRLPRSRRSQPLLRAAGRYEEVARSFGGHFPLINAATLRRLAGDRDGANRLAGEAIRVASAGSASYWELATIAEGHLVRGDSVRARDALHLASAAAGHDLTARATTRRQLLTLCAGTDIDPSIVDALPMPTVIHYCGHIAKTTDGSRFPVDREDDVAAAVARELERRDVGIAFGSLASGADLVIAEAVLARGAELRVVLPFSPEEFLALSVRSAGSEWVDRFERCRALASETVIACDSAYGGDDELFVYASRIAMGRAINRSRLLTAPVHQIAVWDGEPSGGPGGTADDVAIWQAAGHASTVIPVPPRRSATHPAAGSPDTRRRVRGIVFTDLKGFGRLHDEHYPAVVDGLLARLADVIDGYGELILYRNTWGDALQLIVTNAVAAAHCALDLQAAMATGDDVPLHLEMRVAVHAAPVVRHHDPVRHQMGWWGRELTRAARIEPRTPEGEVYATEPCAALLALEPESDLTCEYVGRVTTAKDFETIPLYRLARHIETSVLPGVDPVAEVR